MKKELENQMKSIANDGILTIEDVRDVCEKMKKEKILKGYTFPEKPSSDGFYHIQLRDPLSASGRRSCKAKSLEGLREKVLSFEKRKTSEHENTFGEVFEHVQEEKTKYCKDAEKRLSIENTVGRNRSEYKRFFEGTAIEDMPISEITKKDIEDITYSTLSKYSLRKKGFQSFKGILRSVFRYAYEEYLIADNTFDSVNFNKFKDMIERDVPVDERIHTDEEIGKIKEFIAKKHETNPDYLPAYALELQMLMGPRRGEIPPLMWDDIKNGYIEISKEQITSKKTPEHPKETFTIVNHTKTWKDRRFPVTDEIRDLLGRLQEAHTRLGIDSPYLFPADTDNGVITNNTVYNFYRRICKKLNIPISKDHVKGTHNFRRNAITKVVNATGGNTLMASKLYGNTPEVADSNYYTGLDMDAARDVLEKKASATQEG